jgi:hypothetical protein
VDHATPVEDDRPLRELQREPRVLLDDDHREPLARTIWLMTFINS